MAMARLTRLQRPEALGQRVYDALRRQLRMGALRAGETLQEAPIAEAFGVSRTPVREAFARLVSEGLLAAEPRGFAVPCLGPGDVDDIYEVRCLVEPAALRRVAAVTSDERVREPIESALRAVQEACRAGDADGCREATMRFREAWVALVPNRRLVRIIELYADHMQHIRALTLDDEAVRDIVLRGLTRITEALRDGDADGVERATIEHLREARRAFVEAMAFERGAAPARKAAA